MSNLRINSPTFSTDRTVNVERRKYVPGDTEKERTKIIQRINSLTLPQKKIFEIISIDHASSALSPEAVSVLRFAMRVISKGN